MNTLKNILMKILGPFIFSKSKIVKIEDISEKLRILTIKGKSLKKGNWTPGLKVTLQLTDKLSRSYTPINWNKDEGSFQTAIFLHNNGPLSQWASQIKLNSKITVMGPRASLSLDPTVSSFIFFGDETTYGLAYALKNGHEDKKNFFIFEASNLLDSQKALSYFDFTHSPLLENGDTHKAAQLILEQFNNFNGNTKIVLSGKQQNMVKIRQQLLDSGLQAKDITMKVYWGWKDDPNGKLKFV